jgi:hypothetical protein
MLTKNATPIFEIVIGIETSTVILSAVTESIFTTHSYITTQVLDLLHRLIPIPMLVVAMNSNRNPATFDNVRFKKMIVQNTLL